MAKKKKNERVTDTIDTMRPYIERALTDEEFRKNVREAVDAARGIYGDMSKSKSLTQSASKLASDKDVQRNLQRALAELTDAADRVQGKKGRKKHGKRNRRLILMGVIVGALYNPWTGAQTRGWLLDKIAGEDELAPLDVDAPAPAETNGNEPVAAGHAEG
jgi:hypothetical protein